jgi:hypothetical protein
VKNRLSMILFFIILFPIAAFCEESMTWKAIINPKIGVFKFSFNQDEKSIIVYSMRNKSVIQSISVPLFTENGWLEFMDLDDDGYKDIVIYSPYYSRSGPIPSGEVWIFNPENSQFDENHDFSGEGEVEKAKQRGCVMVTNRAPDNYNYLTDFWCFDKKSKKWVLKKTLKNYVPKSK